jgi:iron complex transport system permease protein
MTGIQGVTLRATASRKRASTDKESGASASVVSRYAMAGLACMAVLLLAAGMNGHGWSWPDLSDPIIVRLRLPRIATALVVGMSLASAGAALQALFRNPLADPGVIGTSSGAALAVIGVMALGMEGVSLPLAACIGGLLATALLLALARLYGGGELALLLMGLVLASFVGAIIGMLLLFSDNLALRSATTWLTGQLGSACITQLIWASPLAFAGVALLLALGRDLDCLMLGQDEANSLGVPVARIRVLTAIGAALAVGAAVSLAGIIAFIGMMVPNACALLVGGTRRQLILVSGFVGAIFLLLMDTLARCIAWPIDVPVGLLVGFVGPLGFLWLFQRRLRSAS